jgi:hypothetical protein
MKTAAENNKSKQEAKDIADETFHFRFEANFPSTNN